MKDFDYFDPEPDATNGDGNSEEGGTEGATPDPGMGGGEPAAGNGDDKGEEKGDM